MRVQDKNRVSSIEEITWEITDTTVAEFVSVPGIIDQTVEVKGLKEGDISIFARVIYNGTIREGYGNKIFVRKPGSYGNATYTDVADPSAYYYKAVYWAAGNGITSGTSPTTFSPNNTCTRGQIVTFLWKALKSPEPSSANNPFTDVKESDYFYQPVLWAKENGVTSGKTPTTFEPMAPCTRGQIVTFLWNAMGRPEPTNQNNPFTDVTPDNYFFKPVLWAKEKGITSGTTATTFSPGKACTRAQAMTFLYKAMN